MKFTLSVWRQPSATATGQLVDYPIDGIGPDDSFLEVIDAINENLLAQQQEPIAYEMDCREGICGSCSLSTARGSRVTAGAAATSGSAYPRAGACAFKTSE
jgi:succinate dehydrogenase/fumarate reductase-like Fe-S protein